MNNSYILILLFCLLPGTTLFAQQQKDKNTPATEIKQLKNTISDTTLNNTRQSITNKAKDEAQQLKTTLKQKTETIKQDTLAKPDLKKTAKKGEGLLEKKASNLQYDSENPDDAPWKKQQISKDDLKELDLPTSPKNGMKDLSLPPVLKDSRLPIQDNKANDYKTRIENLNPSRIDEQKIRSEAAKAAKSEKIEKANHKADSLAEVKDRIENSSIAEELSNAKQIYSDKYIQKMYDSLGVQKADSVFKVAKELSKTEVPKEELINKVNAPLKEKTSAEGISLDEKNESLKVEDADKLQGLPDRYSKIDLNSLQLPPDELAELGPLSGNLVDEKTLPVIDSMRQVIVKAKGYRLEEEQLTDELKKTALQKKPTFIDKSYFEMIIGFVDNSTVSIVQIAPAWAYHFTDELSVGLGPTISLQLEERKKINALIGFRSFVKAELFKQRAYLQVEDNVGQFKVNKDDIGKTTHSLLVGGGGLLPIAKKMAINVAVFYRINQEQVQPGGSPWVFRIGLSSIKNVSKE